ncbi:MAG: Gfo/Idh/MocA family oxidoreductase [Prolixibacteraceae bacterium]|jgi:myo-inositol 2-dehydrogenase / D-chiro-inositol 1-dehydrogenase|nr:Gfo/Idh/MocA family oxidoreductase [Prolixibacteraceae bacterium]MBT6767257.1 Gfo/Idh/MocA family oxidoreductase [Prolixibacteraceae bacterium]MBT7000595.1 Gfo/Idh/MocA family oxidoreductase [Prolixibacteraceae bacterium]MBT7396971.1 Gfo/Idh/MocA family oxidoreductase [Prolixibacteraceae bacterium]
MSKNNFSRRKFLAGAATIGAAGAMGAGALTSCTGSTSDAGAAGGAYDWTPRDLNLPPLLEIAPDGVALKAGIIGCGGRGSGAAMNFLDAGPGLSVTAIGDVFQDRVDSLKGKLIDKGNEIADENCFVGFDAFEKVIASGVDIVILATPPKFRPEHFAASVQAKKHVFMEKPVAVDTEGIRQVIASAKMAESLGLKIITGTQRRHEHSYINLWKELNNNAIGEIVSANVYWNGNKLWHRDNNPDWTEMEWMIRDWVNWTWLSGDHIVEQHVHNLDVANWFIGTHPVKALGFGSRQRRVTGDQYDNFSVDYIYEDGRHIHSMCRQINGCSTGVYEIFHGTKAIATTVGHKPQIVDTAGNQLFLAEGSETSPYVQEHIDLVTCIRQDIAVNEAEQTAISNMVAIMGRVSAYTGKEVTFDEMMNSEMKLGPETFIMGNIGFMETAEIPVPGTLERPPRA